jgi:hypothetical protein
MEKALAGAALVVAVILFPPTANAGPGGDQGNIGQPFSSAGGPFVGSWGSHTEHVTVNADSTGTETSIYGKTVTFKFSEVQDNGQTAYGNIVSGAAGQGGYVLMHLVDSGNGMQMSIAGGDNGWPFCKSVNGNYVNHADCGA